MSFIGTSIKTKITDNQLHCPKCDGEYLHQSDVSFSSYNDILILTFWCEYCHNPHDTIPAKRHHLCIQQHKGNTCIEWEVDVEQ